MIEETTPGPGHDLMSGSGPNPGPGARAAAPDPDKEAAVPAPLRDCFFSDVLDLVAGRPVSETPPLADMSAAEGLLAWLGPAACTLARDRKQLMAAIDRDIAAIDALLTDQVNAILHAPPVQQLEAAWRGLRLLVDVGEAIPDAKIRMLDVSWTELVRDLDRASDFDQSQIFQKVYSDEFGMPGGQPFGLLIGDYEVRHRPGPGHPTDDVSALKALSAVAAAAFVPMVLGVSPALLGLDSFRGLGRPIDLSAAFRHDSYQRWNDMRQSEDRRFVALAMPRVLMRLPYADDGSRADGFRFAEHVYDLDGKGHLWGNAAFAFGTVVLRAFGNFGWFADIRGAPRDSLRGGIVRDLPAPAFATDRADSVVKPSVECLLSNAQERDLAELGLMVLRKASYTDYSVFNECQSLEQPQRFDQAGATASARLSSMLQYTLCVSRFAHFIKVIGRERVGAVTTADECQELLQRWIDDYCQGSDNASLDAKAHYPLREGRIDVKEIAGKPGYYSCTVFLRPHFQLDDVAAGFRLVTELAPARS